MRRLYAGRELTIDAEVSPTHEIRGRREDLDEMLGNLLDNACKWARSRVAISSTIDHAQLLIVVEDDGPGLDPSLRAQVLQRGVRADQQVQGSGLGLAIVSDLAELYGGSVKLETSPLGGTRVRLQLPRLWSSRSGDGPRSGGGPPKGGRSATTRGRSSRTSRTPDS
jgi:signal transduction histidine kinase